MNFILRSLVYIPLAAVILICGISYSAVDNGMEKKYQCEEACKGKNWKCRKKSYNKKENDKAKSLGICGTFFYNCMTKCQKYGN